MLNQIILVGRVTHTIENNTLTLAVPRSFKNSDGEYETDFIPVYVSGTLLTQAQNYLKIGDIVGIRGRIQATNSIPRIVAEKLTFLSTAHPTKDNPNPQTNNLDKGEI